VSEIKLNLIDARQILCGTIHGSMGDACVAALSAEPESIAELEAALKRYVGTAPPRKGQMPDGPQASTKVKNPPGVFASFHSFPEIDDAPWDAGILIIDLAARIVAEESTYSQPQRRGEVLYHNGSHATEVWVLYAISDDWKFLHSIAEYKSLRSVRARERASRTLLDVRDVLYGRPLLEFIARSIRESVICRETRFETQNSTNQSSDGGAEAPVENSDLTVRAEETVEEKLTPELSSIHARWLMSCRKDLEGQSPRDVLLGKQEFIDFDLHTRQLQWTEQGEGPPCLTTDSFAYRFAGFGTHEWVIYYDLVRHLLWRALHLENRNEPAELEREIAALEQTRTEWLENPQEDCGGRIPAILIENERRRLPIALRAQDMIIDDDCELCVMSANQVAMGYGPGFWHLDGSHMDDDFAFSFYRTREEWNEENRRREEFDREFNRRWEEREQRLARGEPVDDDFDLDWIDSLNSKSSGLKATEADETGETAQ
jgi:hypothetical protein